MSNIKNTKYDLEDRTARFGENIIKFAKKIPKSPITIPLISQLVKAGTSVGANYCEADCAESKKDFEHKLSICKKESKESIDICISNRNKLNWFHETPWDPSTA